MCAPDIWKGLGPLGVSSNYGIFELRCMRDKKDNPSHGQGEDHEHKFRHEDMWWSWRVADRRSGLQDRKDSNRRGWKLRGSKG